MWLVALHSFSGCLWEAWAEWFLAAPKLVGLVFRLPNGALGGDRWCSSSLGISSIKRETMLAWVMPYSWRCCAMLIYRRFRARVMATYMSLRSSCKPPCSARLISLGKRPSSMPLRNTLSNSSPLAACTVISCTASCPAPAWVSPLSRLALLKKARMGNSGLSVLFSGCVSKGLSSGRKNSAALMSSSRFSVRSRSLACFCAW